MNLVGEYLNHNKFGKGVVRLVDNEKIEVEFDIGRKKFLYPDAFKRFMKLEDKVHQECLDEILHKIDKENNARLQEEERKLERIERVKTLKACNNSQAVFAFIDNSVEEVLNTWSVFTGTYISGASKGEPRIPQRLNVNSACLLTMKPEGKPEEERIIIGAFMVPDNFKGTLCKDGIINAHKNHRIILDTEKEKLFFWNYCAAKPKSMNWGKCELKYFSNNEMQNILLDMTKIIKDEDRCKKALEFYEYFCYTNKIAA